MPHSKPPHPGAGSNNAISMLYGGVNDASNPPSLVQVDAAHGWAFGVNDIRRYQWHKPRDLKSTDDDVTFAVPVYPSSTVADRQCRWKVSIKAMNLTGSLGTGFDVELEQEFDVADTAAEYGEHWVTIPAQYLDGFHIMNIKLERIAVVDGTEHTGNMVVGVPHVYYTRDE